MVPIIGRFDCMCRDYYTVHIAHCMCRDYYTVHIAHCICRDYYTVHIAHCICLSKRQGIISLRGSVTGSPWASVPIAISCSTWVQCHVRTTVMYIITVGSGEKNGSFSAEI